MIVIVIIKEYEVIRLIKPYNNITTLRIHNIRHQHPGIATTKASQMVAEGCLDWEGAESSAAEEGGV